jgi:hypothetical protein
MSTTATAVKLEFARRAKVIRTPEMERRLWHSRCGRYMVQQIDSRLERRTTFYAMRRRTDAPVPFWDIITRHKTRRAAEAACHRHARDQKGQS